MRRISMMEHIEITGSDGQLEDDKRDRCEDFEKGPITPGFWLVKQVHEPEQDTGRFIWCEVGRQFTRSRQGSLMTDCGAVLTVRFPASVM